MLLSEVRVKFCPIYQPEVEPIYADDFSRDDNTLSTTAEYSVLVINILGPFSENAATVTIDQVQ